MNRGPWAGSPTDSGRSPMMGAEGGAEVSNCRFHRGFGFGMRGTLDRVGKQIPIPSREEDVCSYYTLKFS